MTLVAGRGPLSSVPAGRFSPPLPGEMVYVEPHPLIDKERAEFLAYHASFEEAHS